MCHALALKFEPIQEHTEVSYSNPCQDIRESYTGPQIARPSAPPPPTSSLPPSSSLVASIDIDFGARVRDEEEEREQGREERREEERKV